MKRALIGLPIAFLATGCVHAASMDQVHAGMDRSQVTAMLGTAGHDQQHGRPRMCLL